MSKLKVGDRVKVIATEGYVKIAGLTNTTASITQVWDDDIYDYEIHPDGAREGNWDNHAVLEEEIEAFNE